MQSVKPEKWVTSPEYGERIHRIREAFQRVIVSGEIMTELPIDGVVSTFIDKEDWRHEDPDPVCFETEALF